MVRIGVAKWLVGFAFTIIVAATSAGGPGSSAEASSPEVTAGTPMPNPGPCPVTVGTLALKAAVVGRTGQVSPATVFFDATASTDSAVSNVYTDVHYAWNFGDSGATGTHDWPYGSNPGVNSMNAATGPVAAHPYVTSGSDTTYTATVTAYDGTNTASCTVTATINDPSVTFSRTKTTCVSASGTFKNCPAGANHVTTSSLAAALSYLGAGKRVLFHCGEIYDGDDGGKPNVGGTVGSGYSKWAIGAYDGCAWPGTTTSRPRINDSGANGIFMVSAFASNGSISDLELNGDGNVGNSAALQDQGGCCGPENETNEPTNILVFDVDSVAMRRNFYTADVTQWSFVLDSARQMSDIGNYFNYGENNPKWAGFNVNYNAWLGNFFNGGSTPVYETDRISACRLCVIENNTMENAQDGFPILKLHSGNTYHSNTAWAGAYTELVEISDNAFIGTGGFPVAIAPQNGQDDERLRNIVFERNLIHAQSNYGTQVLLSAVTSSVRDNVFYFTPTNQSQYGINIAQWGVEPNPTGNEVYNNTCYVASVAHSGSACVAFNPTGFGVAPGNDNAAKNNLAYANSSNMFVTVYNNGGKGEIISNNTSAVTNNPGFTNSSGMFEILSDFKPTANYSGGVRVPVWHDALGVPWLPALDLGAVHH
jgi:hypothetical protein